MYKLVGAPVTARPYGPLKYAFVPTPSWYTEAPLPAKVLTTPL